MSSTQTSIRSAAATHGWTVLQDTATAFKASKGAEVMDITFTTAGNVTYGALFGPDFQIDHIDRRTQAKRARVHNWLAYAEIRVAQREMGVSA